MVAEVGAVIDRIVDGELAAVGVDVPIGLATRDPRRCDIEARRLIGSRRSSVFPAPVRGVLDATSYVEAISMCTAISGKGLSKQAFAILPKIREVDRLLTPELQGRLVEVHPEVSFTMLTGAPMAHHKRRPEGRTERLIALRTVFPDVDGQASRQLTGVRPDDVLDAFVVAWSARRWFTKTHRQLGGDVDDRGLRMEIIA